MHYTNPLPLPPKTDKFHNNFLKEMHTTNPLPLLYNIQDNIKNINHNMCKNKINNYLIVGKNHLNTFCLDLLPYQNI